jgi:hypothetical protein
VAAEVVEEHRHRLSSKIPILGKNKGGIAAFIFPLACFFDRRPSPLIYREKLPAA